MSTFPIAGHWRAVKFSKRKEKATCRTTRSGKLIARKFIEAKIEYRENGATLSFHCVIGLWWIQEGSIMAIPYINRKMGFLPCPVRTWPPSCFFIVSTPEKRIGKKNWLLCTYTTYQKSFRHLLSGRMRAQGDDGHEGQNQGRSRTLL